MIAKRSNRRADGRSSYRALARYLVDSQHDGEKLIYWKSANCYSGDDETDIEMITKEIESTQALNARAKGDKTYHLIASFREGENLTREQLDDIEQALADALGMGDHQRIAAVHDNTDHLHIHLAINKVHPETLKIVTPYRDYKQLQTVCRELEEKHGLAVDDGRGRDEHGRVSSNAQDFEAQQGQVSFQTWVKGEPRQRVSALLDRPAPDWADVHNALSEYNLKITPRGAGLIIQDQQNARLSIRASDFDRRFSKAALERRLGEFKPAGQGQQKAASHYQPAPKTMPANNRLWKAYQAAKADVQRQRQAAVDELAKELKGAYANLQKEYAEKRQVIRKSKEPPKPKKTTKNPLLPAKRTSSPNKQAKYSVLRVERLQKREAIKKDFAQRRAAARKAHPSQSWPDWLRAQAEQGNTEALEALRQVKPIEQQPEQAALHGEKAGQAHLFDSMKYHIGRRGEVTYFVGKHQVIDEGRRIRVSDRFDDAALETALRMARNQFGHKLRLNGSRDFQRQVAALAGQLDMQVRFTDPQLEAEKSTQTKHQNPIDVFIAMRNATAQRVSDLPEHRKYDAQNDTGAAQYRGIRSLSTGRLVALLEKGDQYLVKPINAKQAAQLRKHRIGASIHMQTFDKAPGQAQER